MTNWVSRGDLILEFDLELDEVENIIEKYDIPLKTQNNYIWVDRDSFVIALQNEINDRELNLSDTENTIMALKFWVNNYENFQKMRIATQNRLRILQKKTGNSKNLQLLQEIILTLKNHEKLSSKQIQIIINAFPIYKNWLSKIKGIGPVLAGSLIAGIKDISRFKYISSLWKYCGLHVVDGKAPAKKRGQKIDWSPKMRTLTIYKIGRGLITANEFYHNFYLEKKKEEITKHPELTKIHIHNRARRKMVKLFLSHLWIVWRQLENLPLTAPYAVEKLNHHYIAPPNWDSQVRFEPQCQHASQ